MFTINSGLDRSAIVRQPRAINSGPIHRSNPFIRSVGDGEERWRDVDVDHCGVTDLPKFNFGSSDQQIKWNAKRGRNCFERRCGANLFPGLDVGNEALPEAGLLAKLVLRQSAPFADGTDRILAPSIASQTEVGSATSSPRAILAEVASTMRAVAAASAASSPARASSVS
jgi:hypothetical protein